jgi:hypothetical protein
MTKLHDWMYRHRETLGVIIVMSSVICMFAIIGIIYLVILLLREPLGFLVILPTMAIIGTNLYLMDLVIREYIKWIYYS